MFKKHLNYVKYKHHIQNHVVIELLIMVRNICNAISTTQIMIPGLVGVALVVCFDHLLGVGAGTVFSYMHVFVCKHNSSAA